MAFNQNRKASSRASHLSTLLSAKSKTTVHRLFIRAFIARDNPATEDLSGFAEELEVPLEQMEAVFDACQDVVKRALYEGIVTSEEALAMLNEGEESSIDGRLKSLIAQVLGNHLSNWRQASIISRPSLPQFQDVDWRIDLKTATEQMLRVAVPTVMVNLKVTEQPTNSEVTPNINNVNFELSKEALDTMLDGFGKIRDQLNAVK